MSTFFFANGNPGMIVESLLLNHISNIMKYVTLCLSTLLFAFSADAQIGSEKETFEFFQVEKQAQYIGGNEEMNKFIASKLNYPNSAIDCDCQGKVFVEFVIRPNGEVDDVKITRSMINCAGSPKPKKKEKDTTPVNCDDAKRAMEEESTRVIRAMPDWEPASQKGKNVAMRFRLPLMFRLK